jgi:hypothetical protein
MLNVGKGLFSTSVQNEDETERRTITLVPHVPWTKDRCDRWSVEDREVVRSRTDEVSIFGMKAGVLEVL